MDKRLIKLLQTKGNDIREGQMLDTYNQQIQQDVSCTIRTNINTANHHFIVMRKIENYLAIPEATKQGNAKAYEGDSVNLALPNSQTRRGRVGKQSANCLDTGCQQGVVEPNFRIRKLTPRECYRLMGVDDADIDKIQAAGISNAQQYKMAGNSIVVDVLYYLFKQMFVESSEHSKGQQLQLF